MLVGHVAAALVAKHAEPRLPLGIAVLAATLSDILLFAFVLAGIEQVQFRRGSTAAPYFTGADIALSHSLVTSVIWGAALGAVYLWRSRSRWLAALPLLLVVSHWVLDIVSLPPALPVTPGVPLRVGWAASDWLAVTMAFEGALWVGALVLYVRDSRSTDSAGRYVFWGGVVGLTGAWYLNITRAQPIAPPDAAVEALILPLMYVGWGFWMNRARAMKTAAPA